MRRRSVLLLLLLLPAPAQEGSEERVAREVTDAFARGDRGRLTLLAAEPALRVSYPRVVEWLLRHGHADAAEALARERQGPEAEGLVRLIQAFRDGLFPSAAAAEAGRQAVQQLGKDPREALLGIDALGPLPEGTLFAADASFVRGKALELLDRKDEARAEYRRCAGLARAVGEWATARDAEEARLRLAADAKEALEAAEGFLAAARKLDDGKRTIRALRMRAKVRVAIGTDLQREGKPDEARLRWKEARDDYLDAGDLAEKDGDRLTQGVCWHDVALIWQVQEQSPGEALKIHDRAIQLLRGAGSRDELLGALLNSAIVLTALARYDDAIARLDEILAGEAPAAVRGKALAQRARVLGRTGRLRSALPAYEGALAAAPGVPERVQLLVETGQVHLARQDPESALRSFGDALALAPDDPDAWAGRAFALDLRGDDAEARRAFTGALARLEGNRARRAALLLLAAQRRCFGGLAESLKYASEALETFKDQSLREYGNAGSAWKACSDLAFLGGDQEHAEEYLGNAAVLFRRLNLPSPAIELYAQWTLLLIMLNRPGDAIERLQVLRKTAETTPDDTLKSVAKCAEAIYEAKGGRGGRALELLDEAQRLAQAAGDRPREATALVNRALLEPGNAADHVRRALALLDEERLCGPEEHPLVEGYWPDWGPGIALAAILKSGKEQSEDAFALMERALADRLLLALRGRDAVLLAGLSAEQHALYVDARAGLVEARATGKGVAEAEAAFDAMVARLRVDAPGIAALAWPPGPPLAEVQRALREDEALVMTLFDPYTRREDIGTLGCVLVVDRGRATLRRCGKPEKVIEDVADLLGNRRTVLLACGGPVASFTALPPFRICHVPTAGFLLRQRAAKRPRGDGLAALGPAPERFGAPLGELPDRRLAMVYVGEADPNPLRFLRRRLDADMVLVPCEPGSALAPLASAMLAAGAGNVVVGGRPPGPLDFFLEGCLDRKLPVGAAYREARAKGPLFLYGAPE